MYVRGYLQGSENGRVVTIAPLRHFILCYMICYGALALVNIAFQYCITHHIALNEVQ